MVVDRGQMDIKFLKDIFDGAVLAEFEECGVINGLQSRAKYYRKY